MNNDALQFKCGYCSYTYKSKGAVPVVNIKNRVRYRHVCPKCGRRVYGKEKE